MRATNEHSRAQSRDVIKVQLHEHTKKSRLNIQNTLNLKHGKSDNCLFTFSVPNYLLSLLQFNHRTLNPSVHLKTKLPKLKKKHFCKTIQYVVKCITIGFNNWENPHWSQCNQILCSVIQKYTQISSTQIFKWGQLIYFHVNFQITLNAANAFFP
jgi:hypothetical protein